MLKLLSAVSLLLMGAALVALALAHSLFSRNIATVAVQAAAVALMIWARVTFGRRSFHATADPTEGGLVTNGPFKFIRHPIYTAICLFTLAGVLDHLSMTAVGLFVLLFVGAVARMLAEERLLLERYPDYAGYASRTKRMIPLLF